MISAHIGHVTGLDAPASQSVHECDRSGINMITTMMDSHDPQPEEHRSGDRSIVPPDLLTLC
jgi:hypothetical protein